MLIRAAITVDLLDLKTKLLAFESVMALYTKSENVVGPCSKISATKQNCREMSKSLRSSKVALKLSKCPDTDEHSPPYRKRCLKMTEP